jgi:hypothetical protein
MAEMKTADEAKLVERARRGLLDSVEDAGRRARALIALAVSRGGWWESEAVAETQHAARLARLYVCFYGDAR